ncbi:MAG: DUF1684 domain-containing protein [Candidatus Zixiibacteriota bacterium]
MVLTEKRWWKCLLIATNIILFLHVPCLGEEIDPNLLQSRERVIKEQRAEKDRFFKESPRSPLRTQDIIDFKKLNYYPIDLRYVFMGEIERNSKTPTEYIKLPTNKGNFRKYVKHGKFQFSVDGREFVLTIYRYLARSNLFLPFKDKTNGLETYENGRYLEVDRIGSDRVIIDFNKASNPYCAYNPKYTCPYANEENTLDIAVRCGEKRFE